MRNKFLTKILGATLGLAMAIGVGVGVAANNKTAKEVNYLCILKLNNLSVKI